MSELEYQQSIDIATRGFYFYAIIMAAMKMADSENIEKLKAAFPETWAELEARYNSNVWLRSQILEIDDRSE